MHIRALRKVLAPLALALGVVFPLPCRAGTLDVAIRVRGESGRRANGVLSAKAMDASAAPIEVPFSCQGGEPCRVALPLASEKGWLLQASAPGYWVEPATLLPGGSVELWPAGKVTGESRGANRAPAPSEITASFFPAPGAKPEGFPAEGQARCTVANGRFACDLPAGTLDLRLRAKGHVSHYRWSQQVRADESTDLGAVEFRRGASLVGRVVSNEPGAPRPGSCIVRLDYAAGSRAQGSLRAELPRAIVDGRGFFHLEVVPPGSWELFAEQEGFVSARRPVTVIEEMEANLKEPLLLARPARLEVTLLPPQDPDGKPWVVEILEVRNGTNVEMLTTTPASLAGFWSKERLSSGSSLLARVRTSAGQAWWADGSAFELVGPIHKRTIELGAEAIRGMVTLGGEPHVARLTFGAPRDNTSIVLRSEEDGSVSGWLPRLGAWHVVVTSEQPSIHRELEIDVRRSSDGTGRFEIGLQDRALVGEIVDERGTRLPRSILTVTSRAARSRETTQEHVEGGAFRLTGLEPGGYILRAEGSGRVSESVSAEIGEDGSSPFVTIVTRPKANVSLRIVNESGSPVPGARVEILEVTTFPGVRTSSKFSDAMGRVSFSTHPAVREQCFVASTPGRATRLFGVAPGLDEQEIVLPSAGGTVLLEAPRPSEAEVHLLWQGGCFASPGLLKMMTGGDGARFQGLAPGEYRLCRHRLTALAGPPLCSAGYLDRYGVLPLKPAPETP